MNKYENRSFIEKLQIKSNKKASWVSSFMLPIRIDDLTGNSCKKWTCLIGTKVSGTKFAFSKFNYCVQWNNILLPFTTKTLVKSVRSYRKTEQIRKQAKSCTSRHGIARSGNTTWNVKSKIARVRIRLSWANCPQLIA